MEFVMKPTGSRLSAIFGLLLLGVAPMQAQAALIYFSDRAAFNAAAPSLTLETFEEGTPQLNFLSPLDSTTSNSAISPGDIVPGVIFASTEPSNPFLILDNVLTSSQILLKSAESAGGSSLDISFSLNNVFAVGIDVYQALNGLQLVPANTTISIFGDGGLLGTQTVTTSTSGGVFFGVASSGDNIRRINVDGVVPGYYSFEAIDNVAFAAPEPGTLALLGLGFAGLAAARRRKQ